MPKTEASTTKENVEKAILKLLNEYQSAHPEITVSSLHISTVKTHAGMIITRCHIATSGANIGKKL